MLTLYHYGSAICAAKVRVALHEKHLPWEGQIVVLQLDGKKPPPGVLSQHDPAYLKLNPNGVVPTLVHDGKVIIESTVINEYLEDTFPDFPLRPASGYERALMRMWTKRMDEGLFAAAGVLMNAIGYRHRYLSMAPSEFEQYLSEINDAQKREIKRQVVAAGVDAPQVVDALRKFQKLILDMERTLAQSPWLAGETYSLADVAYTSYMYRLETMQMAELWEKGCPHVSGWYQRIKARPSFHEAVVAPAPPANLNLLRERGKEEWPRLRTKLLA